MKKITLTLIAALCVLNVSFATVYYVDDDAAGGGDGLSWATAYDDLQTAIDAASSGDEIWVAKGIYYPTKDKTGSIPLSANDRTKTFYIDKAISIYGNFDGDETSTAERVFTLVNPVTATSADITILSGNLSTTGENDLNLNGNIYLSTGLGLDNSYTVVHINSACQINGCFITAGNATKSSGMNEEVSGGGIYVESDNAIIAITSVTGCLASLNGGGMYINKDYLSSSCSFFGNAAAYGGGIYNDDCGYTANAFGFIGCSAGTDGGAIYNKSSGTNTGNITNSVFYNSYAGGNGGAIYNDGVSSFTNNMINCTFTNPIPATASGGNGGAVYSDGTVSNVIYNSIFYNNAASSANVFYNNGGLAFTSIQYSLLQGANATAESVGTVVAGDGMLYDLDPQFTDITIAGIDLTLKTSSPCINVGDNTILNLSSITTDAQNATRFYCSTTDLGAFERSNGKGLIKRNQVIELDGSSQYVDIGNTVSSFNDTKDFTIEAWVNVIGYDGAADTETILTNRSGSNGANLCISGATTGVNAGKLALKIGTGQTLYSTSTIPVGEWTHVAVSFKHNGSNSNTVSFYINGALDASTSAGNNIATSSANTLIGRETGATDAINAQIEELRIWSDVRTMEEIRKYKRLLLPCGAADALVTYQFNGDVNNALELSTISSSDYQGTAVGSPTYINSQVVLSLGCSELVNVTGSGANSVSNVDGYGFSIDFTGTHPNGDIVLTYLEQDRTGVSPVNANLSVGGQFVVDNYGTVTTGFDYDVTMNLESGDFSNGAANYTLERRDGNSMLDWIPIVVGATAVSNSPKSISFSATSADLGQLLPTFGTVLPVEMTIFEATLRENNVYLDWQTASEENNLGFDIEKSIDGRKWENIGFVEGNGTTYEFSDYQFIDENPTVGVNYYRLKQMDTNGQFEYSEIRTVRYGKANTIAVYPNPTKDVVIVDLGSQNADIQVFDLTGRLLINTNSNNNAIQNIDFANFENGVYILRINGNGWQKVEKIVVQH
ncbi:MAG: LamG-like jellyroll fold domain-containing protein [Saprospiraceae bacterium]